jgi:hypothetical protein
MRGMRCDVRGRERWPCPMEACEASVLRVAVSETSNVALCKSVSWEAEKELVPVRIAVAERM